MKRCLWLLALLVLGMTGCNEDDKTAEAFLAPARLNIEPLVQQYSDPEAKIGTRRTFIMLPRSVAFDSTTAPAFGNELLEKQMLFAIRNRIEMTGYKFVTDPSQADLVVTVDGSNEYKSSYIPPSSVTVPTYVPSRTIRTHSNEYGSVSGYGTYGSAYGTYSGYGSSTTTLPGYWTTRTYERPGETVGAYYPLVIVTLFDAKTGKSVWYGNAVGCSYNPDIRVSSQVLLSRLIEKMPVCEHANDNYPRRSGRLGVVLTPFTPDGENIVPVVTETVKGLPAERLGLKFGDAILAIDGKSTINKTFGEVLQMMTGDAGTECTFTVGRGKKSLDVKLKRVAR